MKIRMDVAETRLTATLGDGAAARDLVSLLPLSLVLEDYAAAEKIAVLPRKLATRGAPAGTGAAPGDFSYYAPWGNLALFYQPAGRASGLVRLGAFDDTAAAVGVLRGRGELRVTIELVEA
jgi:hypothetical protein